MALREPDNKVVLERLRAVTAPLSWQDWMANMKGIPGMKSGECREFYMAQKFGKEWTTLPKGRVAGGSVPPESRGRVWTSTPRRETPTSAPPNVRKSALVDSREDIAGEQVEDAPCRAVSPDTPPELKAGPPAGLSPESRRKLGQAQLLGWVREHLPDSEPMLPDLLQDESVNQDPQVLLRMLKMFLAEQTESQVREETLKTRVGEINPLPPVLEATEPNVPPRPLLLSKYPKDSATASVPEDTEKKEEVGGKLGELPGQKPPDPWHAKGQGGTEFQDPWVQQPRDLTDMFAASVKVAGVLPCSPGEDVASGPFVKLVQQAAAKKATHYQMSPVPMEQELVSSQGEKAWETALAELAVANVRISEMLEKVLEAHHPSVLGSGGKSKTPLKFNVTPQIALL